MFTSVSFHYSGYCVRVSYFRAQQWLAFLHISNALLVTAFHLKMKLRDNALNNLRLSLVMTKLPIKKVTNCSPYFTALQYINNLDTKRSYKRKVNLKNLKFLKKSIERF